MMTKKVIRRNLVIDVGNTLSKVGVFYNDDFITLEAFDILTKETVHNLMEKHGVENVIVSAVGELPHNFEEFFPPSITPMFVIPKIKTPIKNMYKTPETLGTDRLVLAVAAQALYPQTDVLVIDSGTAITYDMVTRNGEYLGGAISPGIQMRFKALNLFTSKLPLLHIQDDFPWLGKTTDESIVSGVLNGVLGEVNGYIEEMSQQFPELTIVFTGGDAKFFDKKLKNTIFVNPNLLIIGLNRILNYNA